MLKKVLPLALTLMLLTTTVLTTGSLNAAAPVQETDNASQAPIATITGDIFRDRNADGIQDTDESLLMGVSGITVTAYDDSGVAGTTTVDSITGSYSLTATGSGPYRIEFTGLPSWLFPTALGANNDTTVQFLSGSGTANLGVHNPENFCELNPEVAIACYENGSGIGNTGTAMALLTYDDQGIPNMLGGNANDPSEIAEIQEIGSVWGTEYHRASEKIYATTIVKRHINFGPTGIGAIYAIDPATSNVTSFDLQGITPANGGSALDFGSVIRTNVTGSISSGSAGDYELTDDILEATVDLDAFAQVAKVSYGDADFNETGTALWTINLKDSEQALIRINFTDPSQFPTDGSQIAGSLVDRYLLSSLTGLPTCTNGVFRPWALAIEDGKGYMGGVCSAENGGTATDLNLHVLSFDPDNVSSGFVSEYTLDLDYTREQKSGFDHPEKSDWRPWTDNWNSVEYLSDGDVHRIDFESPILSDIAFTDIGDMVLGVASRYGFQFGYRQYAPETASENGDLFDIETGADILHVCNVNGTWVTENTTPDCFVSDTTDIMSTSLDNDGPSGAGEYYHTDTYDHAGRKDGGHHEITSGGLLIVPSTGEVMSNAYDPLNKTNEDGSAETQGLVRFNTADGTKAGGYMLANNTTYQGKANGLGEPTALCTAAPIEVGNYIWDDSDGDGIQDPSESGIDGLTVTLTCGSDSASVTTANGGQYYFSNDPNFDETDTNKALVNFMNFGEACTISAPATYNGTPITSGASETNDIHDNDADSNGDISFNAGYVGQNNHSYDIGYGESLISYDWGDLPDGDAGTSANNYPTNNTDGSGEGIGPSHVITTDMYLGSCVDAEADGQPATAGNADQDDANTTAAEGTCTNDDDEDGIVFTTPIVAGAQACVDITVSSVAADGLVNAWMDFNGNGNFTDSGEQIFTDLDVAGSSGAGTYEQCFTVPAAASITHGDNLYSRFRLNDDGFAPDDSTALAPTGPADTGEVEDYVQQPYCVGNYLWIDGGTSANVQDSGDTAAPAGTAVNLVWAGPDGDLSTTSDNETYSTTTDGDGKYHFCGLLPDLDGDTTADDYQIIVPTAPTGGGAAVTADQGGDDTADSDGTAANGNAAESPAFDVPTGNEGADSQTNDTSGSGAGNSSLPDAQDDLSFDFGFMSSPIYDWGDLPDGDAAASADNYPTNSTENAGEGIGPSHMLVADSYLGSCVDAESDGQPSTAGSADQDDANGTAGDAYGTCAATGDDEDGIVFKTPLVAGQQACVDVTVSTATAAGSVVNGWIDFNSNGVLDDAGEQVFTNLDVDGGSGVGTYEHCFTVPATVVHGDVLYSRFRLNDDGFAPDDSTALAPTGPADTGEVEDYALDLGCLGNYVWFDVGSIANVQDSGDASYPNMPVVLTWGGADGDVSSAGDNVTYSTTTDSDGKYHFCGLLEDPMGDGADEYQVSIDLANSPLSAVTQDSGADDALDSDIDVTGATAPFTFALPSTSIDSAVNDSDPVAYAGVATDLTFDIGVTATRVELGDLPQGDPNEPSYGTIFPSGANHILFPDVNNDGVPEAIAGVAAIWAGEVVDADGDGQPEAGTNGDDDDGLDDEDGLTIPSFSGTDFWSHNTAENFTVTASSTSPNDDIEYGLWIDWNEDGDFTDTNEFYQGLLTTGATPTASGAYQGSATFPVTMPAGYNLGLDTVFMRVRVFPAGQTLGALSADAVSAVSIGGHEGTAMNGEVEDYNEIFPAAPTAVSLQDGGTVVGSSRAMLLMLAAVLAVLFITGAGFFLRARRN